MVYLYNMVKSRLCMLAVMLAFLPGELTAKLSDKYTADQPLVIVCDWGFPPYEFSNDEGLPDGFNIEVLKIILDRMNVQYKFVMKESFQSKEAFERHEADLIVDATSHYSSAPYYSTRKVLDYYRLNMVLPGGEMDVKSIKGLDRSKKVLLRTFDYATYDVVKSLSPDLQIDFCSPYEAIVGIANGKDCYFIWGEGPIKWIVNKMGIYNVRVNELDIPLSEMHIVGYDKQLIDEIDDLFSRFEQEGRIERLYDKWFHPEIEHNDTSPIVFYVFCGVMLLVFALFLLNRLAIARANAATRRASEVEHVILQSLSMSHYAIIEFDTASGLFHNLHGMVLPKKGVTRSEMLEHLHPDDRAMVSRFFASMLNETESTAALNVRWLPFEVEGQPVVNKANSWHMIQGHAIAETDKKGVRHVFCALKYVTKEVEEERESRRLVNNYNKIFETSLVAMSFYDKDGWLIDLNQKMREICSFGRGGETYFHQMNLFETPYFRDDLNPNMTDHFHVCQHVRYGDMHLDKFLELKVRPVFDDNGQLTYYTVTARDVGDERAIHMEQRRHDAELKEINKQISAFEEQLHYLLEHSDMWVWMSNIKNKTIVFTRSLREKDFIVSFDEFIQGFVPEVREEAFRAYGEMKGVDESFRTTYEFEKSPVSGSHQWLSASGVPLYDDAGKVTGHIGFTRDVTRLMEAQQKLRQETKRADESGKLKSAFLANMTHEIRTPLNAIVGFSDLLQMIDEPNERYEFIRIICNNCDMLLRLIDDIIEASNMNQGPLAIEPHKVDFASAFKDICQTLAQRVQEPGVKFIVDNPYQSFVTCLDKGRMQQVITNFTTNAVKYTHQGHIKVGYAYLSFADLKERVKSSLLDQQIMPFSGIYMYCEDTGEGIPKEKQTAVFERFVKLNDYVQGTGLGLSICKSIADRCGGRIGVNSEGEGKGSTFWIWIPCQCENAIETVNQ